MPAAVSDEEVKKILREYKAHVRAIVAEHRVQMQKAIEEVDRRTAQKLSKKLGA